MKYFIKSHPTKYNGVLFRSRLEATWACFFDLVGWNWEYEPIDLPGWTPDFRVEFPCGHSCCFGSHTLLIEVKPYYSIKDFDGHPCIDYPFGFNSKNNTEIPADASAAFGVNPFVTEWEMAHGAGGGTTHIGLVLRKAEWEIQQLWRQAGNMTRYTHKRH